MCAVVPWLWPLTEGQCEDRCVVGAGAWVPWVGIDNDPDVRQAVEGDVLRHGIGVRRTVVLLLGRRQDAQIGWCGNRADRYARILWCVVAVERVALMVFGHRRWLADVSVRDGVGVWWS